MEEKRVKAGVLVVSGNSLIQSGVASLIGGTETLAVCAQTGEANVARRLCQEHRPALIVLDTAVQRGNGLALLRDFRRLHPPTRTLVISVREDYESVRQAFRAGAWGFFWMHDDPGELTAGMEKLLAGRHFLSERIAHLSLEHFAHGKTAKAGNELARLTLREQEIYRLIGHGLGANAIARELSLSVKTVESHRQRIKEKLGFASGIELNRRAVAWMRQHPEVEGRGMLQEDVA